MPVSAAAPVQSERPRLVFFYEERSGRSRRTEGFLAQVLQRRRNHATFQIHRVEVGQSPDLADRFEIGAIPTLVVVADRKVQARLEQPRGSQEIEFFLRPWLR
jgi:thioredoxin-like negative regulator of GroEL